jgi:hypothetical protein
MTEAEWLASADPEAMLRFLDGKVSDRKLRLFACACCRHVWDLLTAPDSRRAVEEAERYADGQISAKELAFAKVLAGAAAPRTARAAWAAYWTTSPRAAVSVWDASVAASEAVTTAAARAAKAAGTDANAAWIRARDQATREQAHLLRDIFGDLFHPATADPAWLAWHGGTVGKIARTIYDERRFGDLPVLADALEEAGCGSAALLGHCRRPGEHVRGCWAVDALLERS